MIALRAIQDISSRFKERADPFSTAVEFLGNLTVGWSFHRVIQFGNLVTGQAVWKYGIHIVLATIGGTGIRAFARFESTTTNRTRAVITNHNRTPLCHFEVVPGSFIGIAGTTVRRTLQWWYT